MSWLVVARAEVGDALDTRLGKGGLVALALVFAFGGYLLPTAMTAPTTTDYTGYMGTAVSLVCPLAGLLMGYRTVVGERSAGRLTLLLSLPASRRSVVVGKYAGRAALLTAAVGGGILAGAALVAYPFGTFEAGTTLAYLVVTLAYTLAFLSVGLALSLVVRTPRRATAATLGLFFVAVVVWAELAFPLALLLEYLGWASDGLPDWALFLHGLEPGMLYRRATDAVFRDVAVGPYLGPDAPWYLGEWVALTLLGLWTVLPAALGYLRFRRADL